MQYTDEVYSPDFILMNAQITKKWKKFHVYVGAENLGNYKQDTDDFHYQEFKDIADSLSSMADTIDIQITSLQLEKLLSNPEQLRVFSV